MDSSTRGLLIALVVLVAAVLGFSMLMGGMMGPGMMGPGGAPGRHCQVDEKRASRSLDDSVSIVVQQAHVTASHATNAWVRSSRW